MNCSYCNEALGEESKVQPTSIDGETYCPRCFKWHRVHREPTRFHAPGVEVVHCGCGWTSLSFQVFAGGRRVCGVCGKTGCKVDKPNKTDMASITIVAHSLREAGK